jgi:hypothetical protein
VSCIPCSPGSFASSPGSLKCKNCPAGWLQSEPMKSCCEKVEAGKVVAEGGSASIQFPVGSKICDEQGDGCESTAPFEACMAGTHGKKPTPTNQCYDCEAGKSSSPGATECQAWYVVNIYFFLLLLFLHLVHEINPPPSRFSIFVSRALS